jgi:Spy/CpxP family protein refolding chaperone
MNQRFKIHAVMAASLTALFVSGVVIGRLTAPAPPVSPALSAKAASWTEAASRTLAADLQLDAAQQQQINAIIAPVGTALNEDQESALFTMYLRMLRVHDTISAEMKLSSAQSAHLAASRAKLKNLIIGRFPQKVSENPKLALEPSSGIE